MFFFVFGKCSSEDNFLGFFLVIAREKSSGVEKTNSAFILLRVFYRNG